MIKVVMFQGSFNPFHQGHYEIVQAGLATFDRVLILAATNPEKNDSLSRMTFINDIRQFFSDTENARIDVVRTDDLIVNFVREFNTEHNDRQIVASLRGLRNTTDFEYEKTIQYWNEDLGLTIPFFYVISNREYVHISSSAIRKLGEFQFNVGGE